MSPGVFAENLLFAAVGTMPATVNPGYSKSPHPSPLPKGEGGRFGLCVLGSGSGGNCTIIRLRDQAVIIDLGFGPRTTVKRLGQAGFSLDHIKSVCLTHLDQDHFRPHWMATLLGRRIRVHLHRWHLDQWLTLPGAEAMVEAELVSVFEDEPFEPAAGLKISPIHLAHDQKGTIGFLVESDFGRIGYATDLGHVPPELIERFAGVDVLAIESNYDPPMQLKSPRPLFLKRRIMGHAGHLSNEQAFEAVTRIIDRSPPGRPGHVVLLHRSRQCNCPEIVRRLFSQDKRIAERLTLSEQRRRTRWLHPIPVQVAAAQQLTFEFLKRSGDWQSCRPKA